MSLLLFDYIDGMSDVAFFGMWAVIVVVITVIFWLVPDEKEENK